MHDAAIALKRIKKFNATGQCHWNATGNATGMPLECHWESLDAVAYMNKHTCVDTCTLSPPPSKRNWKCSCTREVTTVQFIQSHIARLKGRKHPYQAQYHPPQMYPTAPTPETRPGWFGLPHTYAC